MSRVYILQIMVLLHPKLLLYAIMTHVKLPSTFLTLLITIKKLSIMKLKKIILLSVLVLCTGQIFAEACNFQTIGGIRYCLGDFSLVADVAPLDDDNEYFGNIVIPATVTYEGKSYKTNVIQYKAFYNCELLTSVTIPNSVWEIGQE